MDTIQHIDHYIIIGVFLAVIFGLVVAVAWLLWDVVFPKEHDVDEYEAWWTAMMDEQSRLRRRMEGRDA